jgi:hypothetical protein
MITVGWTKLIDAATGGSAITGYDVQIWDSAGRRWVDEASLGDVDEYVDTDVAGGATHYYRVRARNSEGPGDWSPYNSNSSEVPAAVPDIPVVTATTIDTNSIRLTWTEPADNGAGIESYTLQRWGTPTPNQWPTTETTDLRDTATADRLYIDLDLAAGTTFYYRVRATNSAGSSTWSVLAQATTVADAPDAPTITTPTADADITATSITLRWTPSMVTGGSAIIRFELEMWDTVSRSWVNVNNAISNTSRSITLSNLAPETMYIYRLRAVNRAPTNNGLGDWSTIHFVDTEAE